MRRVVSWTVLVLVLGFVSAALLNRQYIADSMSYSSYTPTDEIANMVTRSGMSDSGKFYFYSSHPEVANSDTFNSSCKRHASTSPILGCYVPSGNRSYIYDVVDPDLDGIKEVTAAHEMLHVVYTRLSDSRQSWLASRLEDAYERVQTENLKKRMDYYESVEPGSRINELHSILATESRDLGDELEEYYSKYFDNRLAVVELYEGYSSKFYELESESTALANQLKIDLAGIETMNRQYDRDMATLNRTIADFNARASSGYFASRSQFDAERARLMGRAAELNGRYVQISREIDAYNAGVERLNSLGVKIEKLNKSIDSLEEIQ